MEISRQIKKLRHEADLSQEELADKIYVTRQTISNWENDKNYPDINSLVLLSALFNVSLDILVKGDLKEMKKQIDMEDIRKFNRDGAILGGLLLAVVVSVVPLFLFLDFIGIVLWIVLAAISIYYAIRIEKQKKTHDVQTYKEILAFSQGKRLDEIEKIREQGKRPYQTILSVIISGLAGFIIAYAMAKLLL